MSSISAAPKASMLSPTVDLLCVGLLSIIAIAIVLTIGPENFRHDSLAWLLTLATLINGAHFMASYRLLYISREQIQRYRSAAIYVPLVLIAYGVWALFRLAQDPSEGFWIQGLLIVSSLYLALHYTGQTWGMMASYSFVEKTFFESIEKKVFMNSLRALVIWQVVWSIYLIHDLPRWLLDMKPALDLFSDTLLVVAFVAGGWAFWRMRKRIARPLPPRIVVPFFTLFFWYALVTVHPAALLGAQISHAVQYLVFPVRVEINRYNKAGQGTGSLGGHLASYGLVMCGAAAIFFLLLPYMLEDGFSVYAQVLIAAINIHHFYTDGVIWKITSPVVKEDLFAHLSRT